jgi:threonine/homoserine/homoserine lactone efflux protein
MNLLIDGIKIGLALSMLVGPIFFALIQTGIEEGVKAGTAVGLGIWISDLLFIIAVSWGLTHIEPIADGSRFAFYVGLAGSLILTGFGLWTLFNPPDLKHYARFKPIRSSSYLVLWLKGFLINTMNPFTLLFWIGISSTVVFKSGMGGSQASFFFIGILGTIVATDLVKVLMAKKIRHVMRPIHFFWMRRISGMALLLFGVVLLVRVLAV